MKRCLRIVVLRVGYTLVLPVLLLLGLIASPADAQRYRPGSYAPFNPAFLEWLRDPRPSTYGVIPEPVLLPPEERAPGGRGGPRAPLPESYDLRDHNKLTPVKDQAGIASCWVFATMSALESYLMPAESWDFSENHMKNSHGFDIAYYVGGNEHMEAAYLTRWGGPVSEADDPYDPGSGTSPEGLPVWKHVQTIDKMGINDKLPTPEEIKQAVMYRGALKTTMYYEEVYYNPATFGYHCNQDPGGGNHMVCIIGWDDHYSRQNFKIIPPGDGAWIVKNSRGAAWGEGGYFYVSYLDPNIGSFSTLYGVQPAGNYRRIYQYDPLGRVQWYGWEGGLGWFANLFTSKGEDYLNAVGFYTPNHDIPYTISVYLSPPKGPISTKKPKFLQTGVAHAYGYVTIPLNQPIALTAGQKFSVVVQLQTKGKWQVGIEYPVAGYSSQATAEPGQSYVSSDGKSWVDMTDITPNANVCLKAYVTAKVATPTYSPGGGTYAAPQKVTIACTTLGSDIYYTTDGSDPTPFSAKDTGPIPVDHSMVLKAVAWKDYWVPSNIQSAVYLIGQTSTNLTVPGGFGAPGQTITLTAKLRRTFDQTPLEGKTLVFKIGSLALGEANTNASGVASVNWHVTDTLGTGVKTLLVSFAGNTLYKASIGTGTVAIQPAGTKLKVANAAGGVGETVTFTALLNRTTDMTGLPDSLLTFMVDGVEVGTAQTDGKGKGTFAYLIPTRLRPGAHSLKVVFTGDRIYLPSTATGVLTVRLE